MAPDGHALDEDNIIEAWILAKMRAGVRAHATVASPTDLDVTGPIGGIEWRARGPRLWETDKMDGIGITYECAYERRLAEAGIAQWADITDPETGQIKEWAAVKGEIGADTNANRDAYNRVRAHVLGQTGQTAAWATHVCTAGAPWTSRRPTGAVLAATWAESGGRRD